MRNSWFMKSAMFTFRHYLKIFRAIILPIFNRMQRVFYSFMMHNFVWLKKPSYYSFNNEMRAFYISRMMGMRMLWTKHKNISIAYSSSFFIMISILSSKMKKFSTLKLRWLCPYINPTSSFYSWHIPSKIKAAFGGLKETVKFPHLGGILTIKIPLPSSNISIPLNRRLSIG